MTPTLLTVRTIMRHCLLQCIGLYIGILTCVLLIKLIHAIHLIDSSGDYKAINRISKWLSDCIHTTSGWPFTQQLGDHSHIMIINTSAQVLLWNLYSINTKPKHKTTGLHVVDLVIKCPVSQSQLEHGIWLDWVLHH